jgi:hypothetical protein
MDHHHAHGNEHQGKETGPAAARRQRHHRPAPPPAAGVAVIATAVAAYRSSGKSSHGVLMKNLYRNKIYTN